MTASNADLHRAGAGPRATGPAPALGAASRSCAAWLRQRRLALATGLLAALPVIISTVRAVGDGWTPYGDRAIIAARSFDVLTAHSPLVGQYTQWSELLGRPVFSPGPLLYWLLAIPAHFLAAAATPIWMAAVNVGCVVGAVLLARRRGGPGLMFATALVIPLMCRSLNSETFHDTWNPSTTLLPFVVLCFTAWSVACGEYRLLPLAVLLVSFLIETHLTFVAPSLGLLVVALAGLALVRRWTAPAADGRSLRRWLAGAGAVLAACWIAPVADQLLGSGNMRLIIKAVFATRGTLGASAGWHTIVHALGIPPWWLGTPLDARRRLLAVQGSPGWASEASCLVVLAVLIGAVVNGLARRRAATASVAAIALVLALALGIGVSSTPTSGLLVLTVTYTLWWASPAGMFVWLAAGWLVVRGLRGDHRAVAWLGDRRAVVWLGRRRAARGPRPSRARAAAATAAALGATAAVGLLVGLGQPADGDRGEYRPFGAVAAGLDRALPHPGTVKVDPSASLQGLELGPEVVYALERQGATVLVPPSAATLLGGHFAAGARHYGARVDVVFGQSLPAGDRVVARVRVRPPSPVSVGTFTVGLGPGR